MNKKLNGPSTFKVSKDTKYFYVELKFIWMINCELKQYFQFSNQFLSDLIYVT